MVVRVLPTSIRVPLGRGFKLSWRRKKRAVGTCRNSTYEWTHLKRDEKWDPTGEGGRKGRREIVCLENEENGKCRREEKRDLKA